MDYTEINIAWTTLSGIHMDYGMDYTGIWCGLHWNIYIYWNTVWTILEYSMDYNKGL